MGRVEGSAVKEGGTRGGPRGYARLEGAIPIVYTPGLEERAAEVWDLLETGASALSEILLVEPPELEALLVADEDREEAPRENERPYPPGLPYFTRASRPPTLVLPQTLSPDFRPRTDATEALVAWHELAHAFLLRDPMPRSPAWLRELMPQALSAAVARKTGLPLEEHLERIRRGQGLAVTYQSRADAEGQMAFQNLLLALGAAAVDEFGDGFLRRLAHALWREQGIVDERQAEELLAASLGPGGRDWLGSRPEFQEG